MNSHFNSNLDTDKDKLTMASFGFLCTPLPFKTIVKDESVRHCLRQRPEACQISTLPCVVLHGKCCKRAREALNS